MFYLFYQSFFTFYYYYYSFYTCTISRFPGRFWVSNLLGALVTAEGFTWPLTLFIKYVLLSQY